MAAPITSGQTSITGQSTATWPSSGDYIVRIDGFAPGTLTQIFEYVLVTVNVPGTGVLTVTRGQDGTSGQAFAANATLTPALSAKMILDALARIDVTSIQTLLAALKVPPSVGGTVPTTSWGSMPVKIDDQLLGASAASVTFVNPLPTGFRHLLIEWYARGDTAAGNTSVLMRFNNISTTTYDGGRVEDTNNTVAGIDGAGNTSLGIGFMPAASATANYFGAGQAKVFHYNGTTGNKIVLAESFQMNADTVGSILNERLGGKWRTTATAITRIDLLPGAGNFVAGSLFTLWGIP